MNAAIETAADALAEATRVADVERAKIATAERAVTEAETAMATAQANCKAKPSTSTVTAREVAKQLLENAREALALSNNDAQPALETEALARYRHTFEVQQEFAATYVEDIDRDIDAIVRAEGEIRAAQERMFARGEQQIASRKALAQAAGRLCINMPDTYLYENHELYNLSLKKFRDKYGINELATGRIPGVHNWLRIYAQWTR